MYITVGTIQPLKRRKFCNMGESLLVSRGGSFLKIGCNVKLETTAMNSFCWSEVDLQHYISFKCTIKFSNLSEKIHIYFSKWYESFFIHLQWTLHSYKLKSVCPSLILNGSLIYAWFYLFIFYWRIIALQNFVLFCQTSKWISHRYTYASLFNLPPISLPTPLL